MQFLSIPITMLKLNICRLKANVKHKSNKRSKIKNSGVLNGRCLLFNVWYMRCLFACFMVFNATFKNISAILWRSVLLVEETRVTRKTLPTCRKSLTNYHIMLYSSPRAGVEPTTSVVIDIDCICSCKSNYHTITAMTAPDTCLRCSHE